MTNLDALAGRYEEAQRVADDAQLAEVCVEYIDALRVVIATLTARIEHQDRMLRFAEEQDNTLTAQRDAEKQTKTWLRKRLTDTEQTARTYAAQRDAAEKVCEAAEAERGHEKRYGLPYDDDEWIVWLGLIGTLDDALTDWRRTKDA